MTEISTLAEQLKCIEVKQCETLVTFKRALINDLDALPDIAGKAMQLNQKPQCMTINRSTMGDSLSPSDYIYIEHTSTITAKVNACDTMENIILILDQIMLTKAYTAANKKVRIPDELMDRIGEIVNPLLNTYKKK